MSEAARPATRSGMDLLAIDGDVTLTTRAYEALRRAVSEMRIYDGDTDLRLDERALAHDLGISRTPVRAALLRLEHEGLVRTIPRRGVYVVRKTKAEIIEVILASAALESMAARLAAERAADEQIGSLRREFPQFGDAGAPLDEYSHANIRFHQRIVDLADSKLLSGLVSTLQVHMRAIRGATIGDGDRVARSIVDHMHIIEALEARDAELLERHVREHAVGLARHVFEHVTNLD
ncbi:MAG: GntR family transcriptional regulator [Actinomycetota bacterium]|jgi:DNA-binding GntR family transcriptional regulator|nr:GntR family transcriptional regulator [Actinomycetota bacterium]